MTQVNPKYDLGLMQKRGAKGNFPSSASTMSLVIANL